jgi:hypothetical protein
LQRDDRHSELQEFLSFLSQHPEVVAFLVALSQAAGHAAPAATSGLNPHRGPDPTRDGGDGGRRGPDPCHCPGPTGPRDPNATPSLTGAAAAGVGIIAGAAVGTACEAASLGLGSFGCGVVGGAAGLGADALTRRLL